MPTLSDKITTKTTLKMGMSGDLVKLAQLEMAKRGYSLKGTGYFGPATDVAVSTIQRRAKLTVDGELGSLTAKVIDALPLASEGMAASFNERFGEISRPLWLEAAMPLIGIKEAPGKKDNKVIIDWAKEEGGDIAKSYTHDSIPWCALGANHILTKVSLKGTETLWALDFNAELMEKRIGHSWPAVELPGPAVGAFAPMLRDGGGHIICIVGKDQHGNIMGWGCNQTDQVSIIPFPLKRLNKGYWYPKDVPQPWQTGLKTLPIVRSNGQLSNKEA